MAIADRPDLDAPSPFVARAAMRRSRLAGWPAAIGLIAFAATAMVAGRALAVDGLMDLYAGRLVAHDGLPHHDTLTAAGLGHRWIDQQWLAHLLLYGASSAAGWWGPGLVCAAAVGIAFAGLAALMIGHACPPMPTAACLTLVYLATAQNASTRAQTLCYPLFVAVLACVLADERRRRLSARSLLVLPLLVLWANLHGSVLVGVGVVLAACAIRMAVAAWERDPRGAAAPAGLAAAAAATVFAIPYAPGAVVAYYRSVLANPIIPRVVSEWQRPSLPAALPFAVLAALVTAVAAAAWWRGWRPLPVLAVVSGGLLGAGISTARDDVWFALAAALLLAGGLSHLVGDRLGSGASGIDRFAGGAGLAAMGAAAVLPLISEARAYLVAALGFSALVLAAQARTRAGLRRPGGVLVAGAAAAAVAAAYAMSVAPPAQVDAGVSLPALDRVAAFAAAHPSARIMADDPSSAALLWHHPQLAGRVGYDIRYEIYPTASLTRFVRFLEGTRQPGWPGTLHGYSMVVASPVYHPELARAIRHLAGWRLIADAPDDVVAVRQGT